MSNNLAVLVGNSEYTHEKNLECCLQDLEAMNELLSKTGKFSDIVTLPNLNADNLKNSLRDLMERHDEFGELFFYFTGHGAKIGDNFFYCATNFLSAEPNTTGLSDLDNILKSSDIGAVVKVIDACNSGVPIIKSSSNIFSDQSKSIFSNFFRIASCRGDQVTFGGHPLSDFTTRFIEGAINKTEGVVHYSDITAYLRDVYMQLDEQVPIFVTQGDDRTYFCDDAVKMDDLREKYLAKDEDILIPESDVAVPTVALSTLDRLKLLEDTYADQEKAQDFINRFSDDIEEAFNSNQEWEDYYDLSIVNHNDFSEPTTKTFIVRVLVRESRADELVFAETSTKKKRRNPFSSIEASIALINQYYSEDEELIQQYELSLNCSLERVQTKFELTPKYKSLKKLSLVVSFAPSLPKCYVFEYWSAHALTSWDKYQYLGIEQKRRWYNFAWNEDHQGVVKKISTMLSELVQRHLPNDETKED